LERRPLMNQNNNNKCATFKTLAWLFFGSVLVQALYSGIKFGCWLGLAILIMGFVCGTIYSKFRKNTCSKSI
jgi:uncharacterized membrane protein (DUF485 family)